MKSNRITRLTTLSAAIGLVLSTGAFAADTDTATQTVTYGVDEISTISVSGSPGAMTLTTATAGSAPTAVPDATTTYSLTNNAGEDSKMVTATMDRNTPADVTLEVTLEVPDAYATATKQILSTDTVKVLEHIGNVSVTGKTITYSLSAYKGAAAISAQSVEVTFTITDQGVI
jgi:hypothetical protein